MTKEEVLTNNLKGVAHVLKVAYVSSRAGKYEVQQPWGWQSSEGQVQQTVGTSGASESGSASKSAGTSVNKSAGTSVSTSVSTSTNISPIKSNRQTMVPLCFRCKVKLMSSSHVAWKAQRSVGLHAGVSMRSLFCGGECFKVYQQVK